MRTEITKGFSSLNFFDDYIIIYSKLFNIEQFRNLLSFSSVSLRLNSMIVIKTNNYRRTAEKKTDNSYDSRCLHSLIFFSRSKNLYSFFSREAIFCLYLSLLFYHWEEIDIVAFRTHLPDFAHSIPRFLSFVPYSSKLLKRHFSASFPDINAFVNSA